MRVLRSLIGTIAGRRRPTAQHSIAVGEDEDLTLRILRAHLKSEPVMVRFMAIGKVRTGFRLQ